MKKMVSEDLHDFLEPEEMDPELSAIEAVEDDDFPEDENGEEYIELENPMDDMKKALRAEIAIPEYSRLPFILELKDGQTLEGVPMAELQAAEAFLFKIEGQIKKIKFSDILNFSMPETEEAEEEIPEDYSKAKFIQESDESEEDLEDEEGCPYCGGKYCDGNCEEDDE
jgi:hypothetical protein